MTDLEWYLEIGGKQSGPHTAKEIVDLVRAGRIPATAQVTAARMSGDWVTAKDLVEAYDELYQKAVVPQPISGESTVILNKNTYASSSGDPNFRPPPRPTEQLEATKNIFLNRSDLDNTPDPTEALFQAIQAVREKSIQKMTPPPASASGNTGVIHHQRREAGPRVRPQLILILTLTAIFGGTIYGITLLLGGKKAEIDAKKPMAETLRKESTLEVVTEPRSQPTSKLLDAGGVVSSSTTQRPRPLPTRIMPASAKVPSRLEKGGGARYRDDSEPPLSDQDTDDSDGGGDSDADESAPEQRRPRLTPVDPSQVPPDKIIPEPGALPSDGENHY